MANTKAGTHHDFNSREYVSMYYRHHLNMLKRLSKSYEKKLKSTGFTMKTKKKILDAGCAFGELSIHLAKAFPNIECVGIDCSQRQLDLASQRAKEANVSERTTFIKADVQQLPFPDKSFDAIFNINVAHLIDNPKQMFNEFERVLKPGGVIYIKDLRKSILGLIEREIEFSFSSKKARNLIFESNLSNHGKFSSSLLWWNYKGKKPKEQHSFSR